MVDLHAIAGSWQDPEFYIGVDVGQQQDYTAITVVEAQRYLTVKAKRQIPLDLVSTDEHWVSPSDFPPAAAEQIRKIAEQNGRPPQVPLMLVHCRRLPLGLSYPEILDAIVATWHQAVDRGRTAVVVLDASGVGRPLADQLAALRIPHIGVIITGGTEVGWSAEQPDVIRIPKQ